MTETGLDRDCPLTVPVNCDRCCERGSFMEAVTAKVKLKFREEAAAAAAALFVCFCQWENSSAALGPMWLWFG